MWGRGFALGLDWDSRRQKVVGVGSVVIPSDSDKSCPTGLFKVGKVELVSDSKKSNSRTLRDGSHNIIRRFNRKQGLVRGQI